MNYEFKTTFWTDFSIADRFGERAIKDTFRRAFNEWKNDVVYLTELVLVLNWKAWENFDKGKSFDYCSLYTDLYYKAHDYALDHLKGDDLTYYLNTTD